jgi:hydrogenase nickel incorporation protein HypA/HybF
MHEFPEVQELVRQAAAQFPECARVKRLKIVVGEASGHDHHHIAAHFEEASRGTKAEGAVLEFISEELAAKCANCGAVFDASSGSLACDECGGTELVVTAGNGVRLAAVEAE